LEAVPIEHFHSCDLNVSCVPLGDPPRLSRSDEMRAQDLDIAVVEDLAGLKALKREWEALYKRLEEPNPFLSYEWTLACWDIRRRSADLYVATARRGGLLVAVAPLCIERRSGFRILRFIADERSDYLGFLTARDIEQILLDEILQNAKAWDLLLLQRLTDSYTILHRVALPVTVRAHRTCWTSAPYCIGDGDWETFHKSGPSWLREMRKRSRRFVRDGCTASCFTGSAALAWLDTVASIEERSWKGRQRTARLQEGGGQELLKKAFEGLGTRGEIQLWLAFVDDQAVAFQVDFVLPHRLWHYQCAYDENFRRSRAGSVLTYFSMESAWKRGIKEFDYLSGEEPYKLERTNALRPIDHLALHRQNLRGWLAYALLIAPRWHLRNVALLRLAYESLRSLRKPT
jgi:CelD/BcsL family acetyltransferase involved in cellulose biosynthesis